MMQRRVSARLVVCAALLLIVVAVAVGSASRPAQAQGGCQFLSGSDELLPYDDCQQVTKEVYLFHSDEDFYPVPNTYVDWSSDALGSLDSKFTITDEHGNDVVLYTKGIPNKGNFLVTAPKYTRPKYTMHRFFVNQDTGSFAGVTFWEGKDLDPDDDRCDQATVSYSMGGSANGRLEFAGDQDWHLVDAVSSEGFSVVLSSPSQKQFSLEVWKDCSGGPIGNVTPIVPGVTKVDVFVSPGSLGSYRIRIWGGSDRSQFDATHDYIVSTSLDSRLWDPTPPSCRCEFAGRTSDGREQWIYTIQDTLSGLGSVKTLMLVNADHTIPNFAVGTLEPVVVTETQGQAGQSFDGSLVITDVAGNSRTCDPLMVIAIRGDGQPQSQTFSGMSSADHFVAIRNAAPGVKNLTIVVNDVKFKTVGMKDNETVAIDIAAALRPGNDNTIVVTARGIPGGMATVAIADVPIN